MCPSARSSSSGPRLLPSCPLAAPPRHGGGGGTIGEARGFFPAPKHSPCAVPRGSAAAAAFPLASRGRRRAGAFAPPAGPHSNLGREKGRLELVKRGVCLARPAEGCWSPGSLFWTFRLSSHKLTELDFRLRSPLFASSSPGEKRAESRQPGAPLHFFAPRSQPGRRSCWLSPGREEERSGVNSFLPVVS